LTLVGLSLCQETFAKSSLSMIVLVVGGGPGKCRWWGSQTREWLSGVWMGVYGNRGDLDDLLQFKLEGRNEEVLKMLVFNTRLWYRVQVELRPTSLSRRHRLAPFMVL